MFGRIARLIIAALLGGAAVGSFAITGYLSLLESGIKQNVAGVDRVVAVQKEIQAHNAELERMVATTERIGQGMDGLIATSEVLLSQVQTVGEANRATAGINATLEQNNAASARELERVVAALEVMNRSATAIHQYMAELSRTAASDIEALEAISANTARMNARTPRW